MTGNSKLDHIDHHVDLCVVGGGLTGMFAAISAARAGVKVVLIQDRPMVGGNCSSEVRMWVRGACGSKDKKQSMQNREQGLISELEDENIYLNPTMNFSLWDGIMLDMVKREKNITLLLNTSCADAEMDGDKIKCVSAWQLTTYTWHTVYAKYFADCSGDSILAPLTGASYTVGREGNSEFGETIGPKESDRKTMGNSCLIQARQTDHKVVFKAPEWANVYDTEEAFALGLKKLEDNFSHCSEEAKNTARIIKRSHTLGTDGTNFWWIELGGDMDTIRDAEEIRDELLKVAFGVWDHIKNHGDHGADNWELEWVGFLPGKRESRRYRGKHILTQFDVQNAGRDFDDIVAYGGWPMDDHNPAGFKSSAAEPPSLLHVTPPVYGLPYRCFYGAGVENLFFGGRNLSATHAAMSGTRVMGTCALIGQAIGTAVTFCVNENLTPDEVYTKRIKALQKKLLDDGCTLPFMSREIPELSKKAKLDLSDEDKAILFNGVERPDADWSVEYVTLPVGGEIGFTFDKPELVSSLRIKFDPDYSRKSISDHAKMQSFAMRSSIGLDFDPLKVANTLVKKFSIYADGELLKTVDDYHTAYFRTDIAKTVSNITVKFEETWGAEEVHIFSCDVE